MLAILLIFVAFTTASEAAEKLEKPQPGAEFVQRYIETIPVQQESLKGASMEVLMDGRLVKLKKEGKMSALRSISKLGLITYKVLNFWGDDTVKKEVIARYLTAETQPKGEPGSLAIAPANYKFDYKGLKDKNGAQVHVFELKPKQKRVGLFKGELWLDPETCMPIRESGRFVKNPSVFLKKVEFVREYEIVDGISVPKRIESKVDTRIVGRAELNIQFANLRKVETPDADTVRVSQ